MDERAIVEAWVELTAAELVRRHDLGEIEAVLRAEGVPAREVTRLVLLIPSAFAREYYEPRGIEFPDTFLVGPSGHYTERAYGSEPMWTHARDLARRWTISQPTWTKRILDWSAEANAIKEAEGRGLTPTRMSAIHHGFPEP
jgi:hypothetical protein